MFREILVPIGRADEAAAALEIAVDLAHRSQGTITLLHVVELIRDTSTQDDDLQTFYQALADRARTEMIELAERGRMRGVSVRHEVVFGGRVREILRVAETGAVDLIVMQSHRVDPGDPSRGWETISYKVGVLSRCPVMLVK